MEQFKKKHPLLVNIFIMLLSSSFGCYLGISLVKPSPVKPCKPDVVDNNIPAGRNTVIIRDSDHFKYSGDCAKPIPPGHVRRVVIDSVFNGTSPFANFPPRYLQPFLHEHSVSGWGSQNPVFENLIRRVRPRTIIELGSFLGASAIHMSQVAEDLGLSSQILCLDDFRGWPGFTYTWKQLRYVNGDVTLLQQFMQNVKRVNLTENILPLPFATGAMLWRLCSVGVRGDLIEVDAGHDFHSAWDDINLAYRILSPEGVMFGHDYFNANDDHGVRRAVDMFARVKGLRVGVDGEHWILESA